MWLFNWQKIFEASQGSVVECYRIFDMLAFDKIPKNKYDPIYRHRHTNFSGHSFLKRPEALAYNSYKYTRKDICVYIAIASQRSYAEYKVSGTLTLELIHSRIDPREYLTDTTLIPVRDGIIEFPYEELGDIK
jgi:hypothetical protein